MFTWIAENIGAICVCAVLLLIVGAIVYSMVRNRKKGRGSCGGNCSCCAMGCSCHKEP